MSRFVGLDGVIFYHWRLAALLAAAGRGLGGCVVARICVLCLGLLRFAQMPGIRPGGRPTFLLHGKKLGEKTCPAASVPESFALRIFRGSLRSEQMLACGETYMDASRVASKFLKF